MAALPVLHPRFQAISNFECRQGQSYNLLPFRFLALDDHRHVLTNFSGEYFVVPKDVVSALVRHELDLKSPIYQELKSRHFVLDGESSVAIDLLAAKYRTKQSMLQQFTSLFLFVVSLRCDHSCPYCQVSRQSQNKLAFDMSRETADKAIDFMFNSPSPSLKVEFQGGEPLLNFDLIQHIVLQVNERNESERRDIQFVIATNLAFLNDSILQFCRDNDIYFSTSLDGPKALHNRNRPRPGGDSYEKTIEGIQRIRDFLGKEKVAALMTTTEDSLCYASEVIDEYIRLGFSSVFLRPISPYGFAVRTGEAIRYQLERWLSFYRESLDYVLQVNYGGLPFREEYSAIILRKLLTPYPAAYVDLQSPAGIGLSCLVFNYDGDIYASDESRMLAEMGDKQFRIGNLLKDSFSQVMLSNALLDPIAESMSEGVPMCSDCGVQPICGSDPVYHYATQKDFIGFKPTSEFCQRNMSIIRHLIILLEDDPAAASVLRSWCR